jgi:mono/diheme cytochrome c family protein
MLYSRPRMPRTVCSVTLLIVALVSAMAHGAARRPDLGGSWQGLLSVRRGPRRTGETLAVSGTLTQSGPRVSGTISLDAMPGSFAVKGRSHGNVVQVHGLLGDTRLRWRAHFDGTRNAWRGPLVVRGTNVRTQGRLDLQRQSDGSTPICGNDYFAAEVMPNVLEPICAGCHVAGGAAATSTFRVTRGDAIATVRSAIRQVDTTTPAQSKLLLKPHGELGHGGGQQAAPGSPAELILVHWIDLVTAPGCSSGGGGGGTGDLYADNCASCHGADARGLQGRPDIHCSRKIHDVVRDGRRGATENMPAFPNLSDPDIAKIQDFLTGLCPATSVTGAELFAGNCASCHGTDAGGTTTAPGVRCATRTTEAVRDGRGAAMPAFAEFSDAEVGLLETYLADLCTQNGRTGTDLWSGNCAACHGGDGRGAANYAGLRSPDVHCSRNITDSVKNGEDPKMPAFPTLSDTDIGKLQQFLGTLCPAATATGAELFGGNCTSCHGNDARGVNGNPNVRCNRSIHDAVALGRDGVVNDMPAYPLMSNVEIDRMQDYLVGLCPAGTASGTDLWEGNCGTCHGADGGGASGPSVRCATLVDDALQRGRGTAMPTFPRLVTADRTILTTYMGQLCTQAGRTGLDLYDGNCLGCHGATAHGGRNGLGERGPDIQCTGRNDYLEKVRNGEEGLPPFPALSTPDIDAIVSYVRGAFCPGG